MDELPPRLTPEFYGYVIYHTPTRNDYKFTVLPSQRGLSRKYVLYNPETDDAFKTEEEAIITMNQLIKKEFIHEDMLLHHFHMSDYFKEGKYPYEDWRIIKYEDGQ